MCHTSRPDLQHMDVTLLRSDLRHVDVTLPELWTLGTRYIVPAPARSISAESLREGQRQILQVHTESE